MWLLFAASYDGARRSDFERDLSEKHHVIVLKNARVSPSTRRSFRP